MKKEDNRQVKDKKVFLFIKQTLYILLLMSLFAFFAACQPNQTILNSGQKTPAPVNGSMSRENSYDRDLKAMQTANFDYIYVLRRKDGEKINGDDGKYIKLNTPVQTNRYTKTDDEKIVIIGSSFRFADVNLVALRERFVLEDFSSSNAANSNVNTRINSNK